MMNNATQQHADRQSNDGSGPVHTSEQAGTCLERSWCVMASFPPAEHEEFHASDSINLAHYTRTDEGLETGWWGWLVENRTSDTQPQLVIEGKVGGTHFDVSMSAGTVAVLLAATETPAARAALEALVESVALSPAGS